MKNKFKKIMATTLLSMTATTAIGCATTNTKIAQKINNGVEDFVSSINKLDYVETNNSNSNLGKIVSAINESNFYTKVASNSNIENTITRPSERSDNFKLYILSESPYITLTSDDNNNLNLTMQLSTEKIENTSDDISEKINQLILKRAILMIYVNEIYSGNVNLTDENRKAINAYVNIIKENASFLNGNRGMVKNQLGMASNLINNQSEDNIVNYYIIKSGEALEIRSNKIESTISAIDSIISILEQNLSSTSCYYQNNLTSAYQNMITNMENNSLNGENELLAKNITESINMIASESTTNNQITRSTYPKTKSNLVNQNNSTRQITNNSRTTNNNTDCVDCDKTNTNNTTTRNRTTNNNTTRNRSITNNQTNQNQGIQTLETYDTDTNQTNTNNQNRLTNNTNQDTNKTQNRSNISRNIDTNTNSTDNLDNIRRTNRTNVRRMRNTNSRNSTNPTLRVDNVNPNNSTETNRMIRTNERNNIETPTSTNTNTQNINRATRVPYRVSTNNIPE